MKLFFRLLEKIIAHIELAYIILIVGFLFIVAWTIFFPVSLESENKTVLDKKAEELGFNGSGRNQGNRNQENHSADKNLTQINSNSNLIDPSSDDFIALNLEELTKQSLIFEPNISNSGVIELDRYLFVEQPIDIEQSKIDEAITFSQKERIKNRFKIMVKEIAKKDKIFESDDRIILEELRKLK